MCAKDQHNGCQSQGNRCHDYRTCPEYSAGAFFVAGANVLGDDGGDAGTQINDRQKDYRIDTVSRGDGRHSLLSKSIHKVLEKDASHRADTGLNGRRKAKLRSLFYETTVPALLSVIFLRATREDPEPENRIVLYGIEDDEDSHGGLRQRGSCCGARGTPSQNGDEENIENHVYR